MTHPFAVFAVGRHNGGMAATTRAADRGEEGKIGLPGGKVDPGETALDAVVRESAEEGWLVRPTCPEPIHEGIVDGQLVQWFSVSVVAKLSDYKEKGRITPVVASVLSVAQSGYGNEFLGEKLL